MEVSHISAISRRLAQLCAVVLSVSLLTFLLLNLLPGDVTRTVLGENATSQARAQLRAQLGLDRPLWHRYLDWLGAALTGDLGHSLTNGSAVSSLIGQRVPVTLELTLLALILALSCAIPAALLAARYRGRWLDRLASLAAYTTIAAPQFVVGIILILVFAVRLDWLPATGWSSLSDGLAANLKTAILPAASLAATEFAVFMRVLRTSAIQELTKQDYPMAARAKGLAPFQVMLRHVLRNSSLPLVTIVGIQLGTLLAGTVVVETLFGVPGVGQLLYTAISQRDVPVVQGVVVFVAVVFVVVNTLVDGLYTLIDPRTRRHAAA